MCSNGWMWRVVRPNSGEERQTDCESVSFHTPARQFSTVPEQGGSEHTNVGFCGHRQNNQVY